MVDLSEWQGVQRESFSDVYLKVLTPVCCGEQTVTNLTITPAEPCTGADTEMERERKKEKLNFVSLFTLAEMQTHSQMEEANLVFE